VGDITVSRIPRHASVIVNLTGSAVEIAPTGADWQAIAPSTLVNVADAVSITVDAASDLRLNTLVGSPVGVVSVAGGRLSGTLLSLSAIELGDVQIEGAPLLAAMLPDCAPTFEPAADEVTTPAWAPPSDTPDSSISTSTSSSTTTTTVLTGDQPPGSRPVPGAAFALGGAATATHWWLGLPIALLGGVLLGWGWIEATVRVRRAELRRRMALARVERRLARHA
jgi:hypothetical protein